MRVLAENNETALGIVISVLPIKSNSSRSVEGGVCKKLEFLNTAARPVSGHCTTKLLS
jgi:hypothetical protein